MKGNCPKQVAAWRSTGGDRAGASVLGRWEGPTVRDDLCGVEDAAENITEPGQSRRGGKWQSSVILDEAPGNSPRQLRGHL